VELVEITRKKRWRKQRKENEKRETCGIIKGLTRTWNHDELFYTSHSGHCIKTCLH